MKELPPKNAIALGRIRIEKGVVLRGVIIPDALDPRFEVSLIIDEYTNFDAINKNRGIIQEIYKDFIDRFGSDLNHKYRSIPYGLLRWYKKDGGMTRLTFLLNYMCLALTYAAYDEKKKKGPSKTKLDKSLSYISDPSFLSTVGGYALLTIYIAFGFDLEEFNSWMEQGFAYLDENILPIDIDLPFSMNTTKQKLRYFKDLIKEGRITISEYSTDENTLDFNIFFLDQKGYFQKTNELLDKAKKTKWSRNKNLIQNGMKKLIKRWNTSTDPNIIHQREMFIEKWKNA